MPDLYASLLGQSSDVDTLFNRLRGAVRGEIGTLAYVGRRHVCMSSRIASCALFSAVQSGLLHVLGVLDLVLASSAGASAADPGAVATGPAAFERSVGVTIKRTRPGDD